MPTNAFDAMMGAARSKSNGKASGSSGSTQGGAVCSSSSSSFPSVAPTEDPYNPKCDDEPKAKKKRLLPVKQRFDWIEEVAEQGRSCYYCKICSNDVVLLKCLSDSGTQEYFTNLGVEKTQDPGRKAEVHQERASHKAAICRRDVISGVRPSAIEALTKAALRDFQRQKAADSYFIKEYIKLALWCASHEVPHTTMFEPLIDLISSKDHAMLKWAKVRPGNATYRSKATVTELVSLCAAVCDDRAIGRLKRGVTAFGKWSLMLDETSLFGQSIIGIYARYLSADKGIETAELVEDLVACCAISSTKSAAIEQCLISELQSRGVDDEMWSKLAALSCDGAASMSSEGQGLFGRLKARLQLPFLQFQHCRAHRTNLAAKSILATGDHPLAEEVIVLSQQLYAYMSKSNKKLELFKQVHREEPAEGNGKFVKLVEAGGTRWLSHNNSLKRLLRVYPRVVKLLYLISNDQDFDVNERGRAEFLLTRMLTRSTIQGLCILSEILSELATLTRAFQSVDWTLDRAVDLTTTVIQKLEGMAGDNDLVDGNSAARTLITTLEADDFELQDEQRRVRKARRALPSVTTQMQDYARALAEELKRRFNDDCKFIAYLEIFNHPTWKAKLKSVSTRFGFDFEKLSAESEVIIRHIELTPALKDAASLPKTNEARRSYKQEFWRAFCADYYTRSMFTEHSKVAAFLLTCPITSCSVERAFSFATRIDNPHRAALSPITVCSLVRISIQAPKFPGIADLTWPPEKRELGRSDSEKELEDFVEEVYSKWVNDTRRISADK